MKELGDSPKISIVTPSFNQGQFLEETILSVLNQGYPNLEYIIMDGGSTDGSVDIIRKYQNRLTYWVSEPDNGQADAIYRGFERATGAILAWLNSDDYYLPGALLAIGEFFAIHPKAELVIGNSIVVDGDGREVFRRWAAPVSFDSLLFWGKMGFHQPASFWRRDAFFATGGFDRQLLFCFDLDMYLRLTKSKPARRIDRFLAAFRKHPTTKTTRLELTRKEEEEMVLRQHGRDRYLLPWVLAARRYYSFLELLRHLEREAKLWARLHIMCNTGRHE